MPQIVRPCSTCISHVSLCVLESGVIEPSFDCLGPISIWLATYFQTFELSVKWNPGMTFSAHATCSSNIIIHDRWRTRSSALRRLLRRLHRCSLRTLQIKLVSCLMFVQWIFGSFAWMAEVSLDILLSWVVVRGAVGCTENLSLVWTSKATFKRSSVWSKIVQNNASPYGSFRLLEGGKKETCWLDNLPSGNDICFVSRLLVFFTCSSHAMWVVAYAN